MSSITRKLKRKPLTQKRKDAENYLKESMNMFDRMPNECSACSKPFDKKSKEMAQTWTVVIRNEQKLVRLFCPECIDKVKEILPDENKDA